MDLQSLGHAAGMYQRSPREISAAIVAVQATDAEEAGKRPARVALPALTLNGVAYFESDMIARAIAWLAEREVSR